MWQQACIQRNYKYSTNLNVLSRNSNTNVHVCNSVNGGGNGKAFKTKSQKAWKDLTKQKLINKDNIFLPSHVQNTDGLATTLFVAETSLPTVLGKFRCRAYRHTTDGGATYQDAIAIVHGAVENQENIPMRVHDQCQTSEVFYSMKCDCKDQLQWAMCYVRDNGPGIVIYLQQEGRGIGLGNKIAAYAMQEHGLDTVDANRAIGMPDDCREYTSVSHILNNMGVKSIQLITNNPRKMDVLQKLGIVVSKRIPIVVDSTQYSKQYLETKQKRMGHDYETPSDGGLFSEDWELAQKVERSQDGSEQ